MLLVTQTNIVTTEAKHKPEIAMNTATKKRLQSEMRKLMNVLRVMYNNRYGKHRTMPNRKWGELACENSMANGWDITEYGVKVLDYLEYHNSLGYMPTGIPGRGL